MSEFINIADPRVLAIPIVETNEPLIDLREQSIIAFGPTPESPLTEFHYTKLRHSVYKRLVIAQSEQQAIYGSADSLNVVNSFEGA